MTSLSRIHRFACYPQVVAAAIMLVPLPGRSVEEECCGGGVPVDAKIADAGWVPPPVIMSKPARAVQRRTLPKLEYKKTIGATPTAQALRAFRPFRFDLKPRGQNLGDDAGNIRVKQLANDYVAAARQRPTARLAVLQQFLDRNLQSPFALPVALEQAALARDSGDFSGALAAAERAWTLASSPETTDADVKARALAMLLNLCASLGQRHRLDEVLESVASWPSHPLSSTAVANAKAAAAFWAADSENSTLCGIYAFNTVSALLGGHTLHKPTADWVEQPPALAEAAKQQLQDRGMSAADLSRRIAFSGANWRWIKRTTGGVLPVPSVVHLTFGGETGHYSALTAEADDFTRMVDTFLQIDRDLENSIINKQCSGYFLVPGNRPLPPGFVDAPLDELDGVVGRVSCPYRSEDGEDECEDCGCKGMAVASISDFLCRLVVRDSPLNYRPKYGPTVDLTLQYKSFRPDLDDISVETSNFGPYWSHGLISYIRAEDNSPLPGTGAVRFYRNGTPLRYTRNGAAYVPQYAGRPTLTEITGGFRITYTDGTKMDFTAPNGPVPTRYYLTSITDADGQTLSITYKPDAPGQGRIEQIVDAEGLATEFTYSEPDPFKISKISDPFGHDALFSYDNAGRLQSITDPLQITSSFVYQNGASPHLMAQMTTPYGTSTFAYTGTPTTQTYSVNWSVSITDPAGETIKKQYLYHDGMTPFTNENIGTPEPRPPESISVGGTPVAFLTTVPQADHFHATLSWSRDKYYRATQAGGNPQDFADYTLWMQKPDGTTVSVPLATRKAGHSAEWYNYPGQTVGSYIGTSTTPTKTVQLVEPENHHSGGQPIWRMTQQTYNSKGLPLEQTDALGRKTRNFYFATAYTNHATWGTTVVDRDVQHEEYLSGTTWYVLRYYGKYVNGTPGTTTEASGRVTTITRNAKGQVTESVISKSTSNVKTRNTYSSAGAGTVPAWPGAPGFLRRVEMIDPANAAQWVTVAEYTYDSNGNLLTDTDATGYTRTHQYDTFNRRTLTSYPDGSNEQYSYASGTGPGAVVTLDLTATKDRADRWSRTIYNKIRKPIAQIDPAGRVTLTEWCRCGSISKLTDPLNRVTQWKRDIAGRVTEKIMPDGVTKTLFSYMPLSGQLAAKTNPKDIASGPTVRYSYTLDGKLKKEDYTDTGTPDVTYHYTTTAGGTTQDPLGRLRFVQDGIGTHTFTYIANNDTHTTAVPAGADTAGEGQLQRIDGPFANDDLVYYFDWQDRPFKKELQSDAAIVYRSESLTFDTLGRTKTLDNALGTFTYGYNTNLSRPDTITGPQSLVTSYSYYPNTAPGTDAQRLFSITHSRTGTQYSKHSYTYDRAGRITGWNQETSNATTGTKGSYDYNLADELTRADKTNLTGNTLLDRELWGLDTGGNWLSHTRTSDNLMETRSIDVMNRLNHTGGAGTTVVEGKVNEIADVTVNSQPAELKTDLAGGGYRYSRPVAVTQGSNTINITAVDKDNPPNTTSQNWQFTVPSVQKNFTYDANGNTLSDGTRTFTWDAKNRLKSVTKNGSTWSWDYDYRDRRVREKLNGTLTSIFIWQDNDLIQERNGANVISRTHLTGGFEDRNTTGTVVKKNYLTTTDHLGHIREVIIGNTNAGAIGTLVARYDYTPYQGPQKVYGTTVDASLLTIGRYYHHAGSGLELALYRAYDPELGRWMSEDPIEEKGGLNLYVFNSNDPIAKIDSLGLKDCVKIEKFGFRYERSEPLPGSGRTQVGCAIQCRLGGGGPDSYNGIEKCKNNQVVFKSTLADLNSGPGGRSTLTVEGDGCRCEWSYERIKIDLYCYKK